MNHITVGDNTIIGEDCVVHVSSGFIAQARPTTIGNGVIVGARRRLACVRVLHALSVCLLRLRV